MCPAWRLRVPLGLLRGSRFWLDPRSHKQLYFGLWERELLGWTKLLASGARTAIDVGAGDGEYTLFFAGLRSIVRVIAIESDRAVLSRLVSNLRLNGIEPGGGVEVVAAAMGAADNGVTTRLDSIVLAPALPLVVKVDVEGAECDVLRGGRELLGQPNVRVVVETHGAELERECVALLASLGFDTRIVRQAWWRALVPERRPLVENQWLVGWKRPVS